MSELHRMIHKNNFLEGKVSFKAFVPRDSDHGKLSTYNGNIMTNVESLRHWLEAMEYRVRVYYGVGSIPRTICQNHGLDCIDDGKEGNLWHTSIDFNNLNHLTWDNVGLVLANYANDNKTIISQTDMC